MSLINEALKKAQRQRTDAAPPATPAAEPAGGPVSPRIVKRRPPMPARALMLLLTGGALVLLTGIVIALVLINLDTNPPAAAKNGPPRNIKHEPPPPVAPSVPAVVLPPPAPVTVPVPKPVPTVVLPPPPRVVPEPIPAAPPKPVANPEVYAFLESMRITGVRVSGGDSKIIMNDRIVRLNDNVNRALGLRLTEITTSHLVFTDAAGFRYTKDL